MTAEALAPAPAVATALEAYRAAQTDAVLERPDPRTARP